MSYLYIIIAAALWGTTGAFSNLILSYCPLSSLQIGAVRVISTVLLLFIWLLIVDREAFKIKLKDLWVFVGTGILSLSFFTYCYFVSIKLNGVAIAAVLLYTAPIFVAIISALVFKIRLTVFKIIAIVLVVFGCCLVSGILSHSSYSLTIIGLLYGIGSGFGYSLYTIFAKVAILKGYKSLTVTFYTFLFSSFAFVPLSLFDNNRALNISTSFFILVIIFVLFGLITGALPYIFYTKGLQKTEPSLSSIISTVEPIVASIFGIFVFNEKLTLSIIFGIVLIIFSIIIGSINVKKVE